MREIYLDNSATTRCFPETAELMNKLYLEEYGNPSSMHHKGVEAERRLTEASAILAGILKVRPANLIYTSCGTESDNLAIIGAAMAMRRSGRHLITTVIEHPAVLETMRFLEEQGFEVTYLPVDADGQVSPQAVEAAVREDTLLVSVMHTNNEIGTVQPIEEIGAAIKRRNPRTLFHVDAVQGFGKARILPKKARIDLLSVSGHKIHAAKGVGFLYIGDGCRIRPILFGGGQQKGMRSGTQNTAGIAGMALSARILYDNLEQDNDRLCRLRDLFISLVTQIPDAFINGMGAARRAPHIISLTVPGVRAEVLLHALEDKGVYVSSGSACASNRPHLSGTLSAIGLKGDQLDNTIRISLSVMNTEEDVREAAAAIAELVPFLRRYTRH
ncbi:MAG TPA: cysteine desulfurase NifS [Lachnospiraceae bacterium]|nr:cysteine desulfurase NifS [Lachnospiraceae bacterium]